MWLVIAVIWSRSSDSDRYRRSVTVLTTLPNSRSALIGIEDLHGVGSSGQEPCKITAAGTDVQGEVEAPRQLPQDPAMVVGIVIPGISGVEPFKSPQDTR